MSKHVRVLIVDDSAFYRKRIRSALSDSADIEVVGEAQDGQQAVDLACRHRPDLITMDVAMPVLDGIGAVRRIMRDCPTRIIMFSALTRDGADATLRALEAGAVDFLPKIPHGESMDSAAAQLRERVLGVARGRPDSERTTQISPAPAPVPAREPCRGLLVIGASTGGPMAVQTVLGGLPASFPLPVLVAIHMPGSFTSTYAARLDAVCPLAVREARDGSPLQSGQVLVAPGGLQTEVIRGSAGLRVRVGEGDGEQIYNPSVNVSFASAARALGGDVIGIVLTGMGSDGAEGARRILESGGHLWAQDQASSVVYGMPRAVAALAERILPLEQIAPALLEAV
jgi:two-component system chemotaxis response regulator CheB